jgi:hypothetical protein
MNRKGNFLCNVVRTAVFGLVLSLVSQFVNAQTLVATAMKKVIKSVDGGKTWTPLWDADMDSKAGGMMTSVAYGNGKLVATGDALIVSEDEGKTWKEIQIVGDTKNNLLKKYYTVVGFGDGIFVLATPFRVLYSTDGYTWKYVTGGSSATASSAIEPSSSENSGTKTKGLGNKLKGIASNPKGAADDAARNTSSGSSSPSATSSNTSRGGDANPPGMREATEIVKVPRAVTFANGKFFITGGSQAMELAVLSKSGNDIKLEKKFDLYGEYGNAATTTAGLGRLATDGKTIVAVTEGSTKSAYSLDGGNTWKFIKNTRDVFTNSVAYGNGVFVTCNGFGEVLYTSDITQGWTGSSKFYQLQKTANRVFFDGTKFFILCHDQEIFTSKDGKEWTFLTDKPSYGNNIFDVVKLK